MFEHFLKFKILIFLLLIVLSPNFVLAQYRTKNKKSLIIKKIVVDYLSTGHSGFEGFESRGLSGLNQRAKAGKWGKVEIRYRNYLDWVDELTLTFYVLMSSGVVLTETLTQINISKGPDHYAALYLHPTTLKRHGEIKRVAVEISSLDGVQDASQWPNPSNRTWWTQSLVKTGLLKKSFQTPFILDQPERYEDTKW